MDVTNKIALVTGGGRGIGRGICLALATNGADVAVSDINTGDAQGVTKEVESLRRRSLAVTVDVTGQGSVESMVADVIAQFGRIDILVNNAGIIAAPGLGRPFAKQRGRLGHDIRYQREGRSQGNGVSCLAHEGTAVRKDCEHRVGRRTAGQRR